jgi:hypothetical protein
MKHLSTALIYLGFSAAISIACYVTKSALPLLALLLLPSIKFETKE